MVAHGLRARAAVEYRRRTAGNAIDRDEGAYEKSTEELVSELPKARGAILSKALETK